MRIVVIGAGISGLLSAYYLLKRGHEVQVLESGAVVASKASGANAAQLSYTYVNPIGSPSLFRMLPAILLRKVPGFQVRQFDREMLVWGMRLLMQSLPSKFLHNRSELLKHSLKSRELFAQLLGETGIKLSSHSKGKMQIFHTEQLLASAKSFSQQLQGLGIEQQWPDKQECQKLLGAFTLNEDMVGAVYSNIDETADCTKFCWDLLEFLKQQDGFTISFDSPIKRWHSDKEMQAVETKEGRLYQADKFLLCTGAQTNQLVDAIGLKFPIFPVKGYTLVYDTDAKLGCSVTDHQHKVVFVPMDGKLMVSGMFHLGGQVDKIDEKSVEHIHRCASLRIPELKPLSYQVRCGLRPCTPNSQPIIEKTKYNNLFINSGHGMYGWTLAPACADEVAELISE